MDKDIKTVIFQLAEKLKKDKKALAIIVIGITGMLIIMLSGQGDDLRNSTVSEVPTDFSEEAISEKVTQLIESIDGAGDTRVMITYECGNEIVYAADSDESSDDNSDDISREYIIIEENNNEAGLIIKTVYPKVMGVAIICQGGDNPAVKQQICSVISALFNLSTNKISIATMA